MTSSCLGTHWAVTSTPSSRVFGHNELDTRFLRSSLPSIRRSACLNTLKVHASASMAPTDAPKMDSPRPPCYQQVWMAPEPSRVIKDKRAFLEEHR